MTTHAPSPTPDVSPIAEAPTHWPLERALFALAGTVILLGSLLAAAFSTWFLLLTAFVGASLLMYVAFRACPASLLLQRFGLASQCEW